MEFRASWYRDPPSEYQATVARPYVLGKEEPRLDLRMLWPIRAMFQK